MSSTPSSTPSSPSTPKIIPKSSSLSTPQKSKNKIIITGIGGFVGRYAALHFQKKGFEVYGFDRHGTTIPNCHIEVINIVDKDFLHSYLQKIKPTHLLHLAAQSSVKKSWDEPELTRCINVEGTKNLLESITSSSPKCQILIVSSAEIYGIPAVLPITEKTRLNPLNPYAKSRLDQEQVIDYYQSHHQLNIIIARSFPHTGQGQSAEFVCSNFAQQIALIENNKQPPILTVGNLEAKRDFTDVQDVVNAYYLLLTTPKTHGVYNVCSNQSIPINEVLTILLSLSKIKIKIKQDPKRMRPSDIPNLLGDNTKLKTDTNWQPTRPLQETLQNLLNYWRSEVKNK